MNTAEIISIVTITLSLINSNKYFDFVRFCYNIASRAMQSNSVTYACSKLTNRFHVAVRLFSNRSQMTSKCGKNISDTLGYASCATFLFLPHFDVICDLLLNRRTATWNLFVKWSTWEVCRTLKKLEFPSATPRATLTLLSCSPNFPRAP